MADVFRIQERFNITGHGIMYVVKNCNHSNIKIGDELYDLRGNHFKLKAIEMFRVCFSDIPIEDWPLGITLENLDSVDVEGNILVTSLVDISFIFCNHPLYPRKVDEDYETEYQNAALNHPCALFSYEDLESSKLTLYGESLSGLTIYRGWMMKPELYRKFFNKLEEKGIALINTPEEYERYHMLPGWYSDFEEDTAQSVWENQGTLDSAMLLTKGLTGSYIVKDYVKSRKHEWHDACFIRNIADMANSERIISNFINRQGEDLVGGVVLRQYEKLKAIGYHEKSGMPLSEEYRVFVYAGRILIVDDYWRTDTNVVFSEKEQIWLDDAIKKLRSNFVTMDLARCEDGRLIIMELGDGQVSGLQQIKPENFYKAFI